MLAWAESAPNATMCPIATTARPSAPFALRVAGDQRLLVANAAPITTTAATAAILQRDRSARDVVDDDVAAGGVRSGGVTIGVIVSTTGAAIAGAGAIAAGSTA